MFVFFAVIAAGLGTSLGIAAGKLVNKALGQTSTLGGLLPSDPFPSENGHLPWVRIIFFCVLAGIGFVIVKKVARLFGVKVFSRQY